jgi:hypothetical protein
MLCTVSGIFNSVRYSRMYSKHYEQRLFKKLEEQHQNAALPLAAA